MTSEWPGCSDQVDFAMSDPGNAHLILSDQVKLTEPGFLELGFHSPRMESPSLPHQKYLTSS